MRQFTFRRPFGEVATFRRGDEFFDWLCWYVVNSELSVSGMVWIDHKPVNTADRVLEMGRSKFLAKFDPVQLAGDDEFEGREMVTYAHKDAPQGTRFRDFKGNEPQWAVDIQPEPQTKAQVIKSAFPGTVDIPLSKV